MDRGSLYFAFFNEIGIIAQLSRAAFEARLPDGVTLPHFAVLNHLIRVADGRTPLELARAFQVPKTSMTNTLAGLEARGLVETRPNPKDKRSKRVWLTEEGRRFRDEAIDLLVPTMEALAKRFPPAEIGELVPKLSEIRSYLDASRDDAD
ncbi:MarR family transcriptional regulator [Aquibium sp. ELW1220]|jgi:DNA-binding MarR family transcriptional regulator|uniref:MarR family winged helix-turn-helix transcriptional regulator n=1 Tax=Aquibium sp. ELW1220 TaxID=2976766 RepID=UPI0025B0C11F|nr:MarR family transcriptional regulator [Aquibium sp. ELW1220]MDN2578559.1 MarR family transcriptional regulator [Aquibium sp. ELW1220]